MGGVEYIDPAQSLANVADSVNAPAKRPVVCLMGEFSAGKSTLSNLLLGMETLPVNVTATQLPPVWISEGDAPASRVDLDQTETELPTDGFEGVSPHDTSHIRVYRQSKFLRLCDLIDMPGISDPNMAADVWQRMIHHADIVIWCSHATQAWRQSEAAVWSTMPAALYEKSILLLTRMDKILSERDQGRVVKRVESETKGLFRKVLPVSLIKALKARDDPAAWEASGANLLMDELIELCDASNGTKPKSRLRSVRPATVDAAIGDEIPVKPRRMVMPTRIKTRKLMDDNASASGPSGV